jgi:hypothetical protein
MRRPPPFCQRETGIRRPAPSRKPPGWSDALPARPTEPGRGPLASAVKRLRLYRPGPVGAEPPPTPAA